MRFLRFLLWLFAAIGVLATGLFAAAVAALIWVQEREPSLPDEIVLTLQLDGELDEVRDPSVIPTLLPGQSRLSLFDIVRALDAAAADDRVSGVAVDLSQAALDLAEAGELRSAIARFRASGKSATAFSESFDGPAAVANYYLATGFERIDLQPSGTFSVLGITAAMPLVADLLEEHGIQADFDRRHEYKGVMIGLTERELPDAVRGNLRTLITSQFEHFVADAAAALTLSPQRLRELVDQAPLTATDALAQGLVDRLGYRDDWLDTTMPDDHEPAADKRAGTVELADYRDALDLPVSDVRIAVIEVAGSIARGEPDLPFGARYRAVSGRLAEAIGQAREDTSVRGLILRIDSPGGDYIASDAVRDSVARFRNSGRSVVASMSGVAASAAYFIAVEADRILAHPGTVTGSIGVAGGKVSFGRALARHGIAVARESVGENAAMYAPTDRFDAHQQERHAAILDGIYDDFAGLVADRRGLGPDELDHVARGRVWSGSDALKVGLVDGLGGFHEAIRQMRELSDLTEVQPVELVVFPREPDRLEAVRSMLDRGGLLSVFARLDAVLRTAEPLFALFSPLLEVRSGISALQPGTGPDTLPE